MPTSPTVGIAFLVFAACLVVTAAGLWLARLLGLFDSRRGEARRLDR